MNDAYTIVLALHNIVRWFVVLLGLAAAGMALYGWFGKKSWTNLDNQLGLYYTIAVDTQVLLGLLLYFLLSPITKAAFSDFGASMADADVRFWSVEHIAVMILVLVLAHVGRSRSKKAATDTGKFKNAAIFFTIAAVITLLGIPWFRPLLPAF